MSIMHFASVLSAAGAGGALPALARTCTLGKDSFDNQIGYRGGAVAFGSVSDDSFGSDTVTFLLQEISLLRFQLRINNDALVQDAFTTLSIDTVHLGRIHLLSADVAFFGGSGFRAWEWATAEALWRLADVSEVLGWAIDGA